MGSLNSIIITLLIDQQDHCHHSRIILRSERFYKAVGRFDIDGHAVAASLYLCGFGPKFCDDDDENIGR